MLRAMEVLGRMLVFRRVAAAHVAAFQAQSQMDPAISHLQALLAAASVRRDLTDLIQMRASCHVLSSRGQTLESPVFEKHKDTPFWGISPKLTGNLDRIRAPKASQRWPGRARRSNLARIESVPMRAGLATPTDGV